jgi:hypothetical protein
MTPSAPRAFTAPAAILACAALAPAQTLFSDNFNAGASPQWSNERGAWVASGGAYAATQPSNAPPTLTTVPYVVGDCDVEVDVIDVIDGGIWMHVDQGAQNGVLLVTGGYAQTGTGFYWHTVTGGSYSPILNPTGPLFAQMDDLHLRITARGATYALYLNGNPQPVTTLTLPQARTGVVGLYDYAAGAESFDNFVLSAACYANCDASTTAPVLNVLDFNCFLNRFSAGDSYANCDGSTTAPVLNVLDFNCFLNRFSAGCS